MIEPRSKPAPVSVMAAFALLRAALPTLPPGGCVARLVVVPGSVSRLVSVSGAVLVPGAWRLVCSVSGEGGWLLLAPAAPAADQPILF